MRATAGRTSTWSWPSAGYPAYYAKGAHLLPDELTAPLAATLVRAPDEPELRRALAATIDVVTGELERSDPGLAERLRAMLTELAGSRDDEESHERA